MAATEDDGELRDLAARKGMESGSSGGGRGLQLRKEMSKALTPNPLFIHSSIRVLVFFNANELQVTNKSISPNIM